MEAHRIAFEFGRWDVDRFLEEIDHDQLERWREFFRLRPNGWDAINLQTARLAFWMLQVRTKKKIDESKLMMTIRTPVSADLARRVKAARWEAMSIRTAIENGQDPNG